MAIRFQTPGHLDVSHTDAAALADADVVGQEDVGDELEIEGHEIDILVAKCATVGDVGNDDF